MWYKLAADLLVLIHFSFIIFVVLGGLLVLRWAWIAWLHIPCAAWGIWIGISRGVCPLTSIEKNLREAANVANYEGGFIANYIIPVIYPPGFSPGVALLLGTTLAAFTVAIYAIAFYRHTRQPVKKRSIPSDSD